MNSDYISTKKWKRNAVMNSPNQRLPEHKTGKQTEFKIGPEVQESVVMGVF